MNINYVRIIKTFQISRPTHHNFKVSVKKSIHQPYPSPVNTNVAKYRGRPPIVYKENLTPPSSQPSTNRLKIPINNSHKDVIQLLSSRKLGDNTNAKPFQVRI